MPWIKAADVLPSEDEEILIYHPEKRRMEVGRYSGGAWYAEDSRDGGLTRIAGVTHWAPVLDSESYDDSDDD